MGPSHRLPRVVLLLPFLGLPVPSSSHLCLASVPSVLNWILLRKPLSLALEVLIKLAVAYVSCTAPLIGDIPVLKKPFAFMSWHIPRMLFPPFENKLSIPTQTSRLWGYVVCEVIRLPPPLTGRVSSHSCVLQKHQAHLHYGVDYIAG